MSDTTSLRISDIRIDGGTQPRAAILPAVVAEYAEEMTDGAAFPPVVVFYDGLQYWLADGFHRVAAAMQNGFKKIDADVKQGTQRDAVLYSVGANSSHGLRRTNADKRRAVETLLRDEEWSKWSNSEIARRCGVNHHMVADMKASLGVSPSERTYTTKHGTVSTMQTGNIGKREIISEEGMDSTNTPAHVAPAPSVPPRYVQVERTVSIPEMVSGDDVYAQQFIWWVNHVTARAQELAGQVSGLGIEKAFALALSESFREGRLILQ